jgi:hypothetical protein
VIGHSGRVRIRPFDASDTVAVIDLSLRAWAPVHTSIREALGPEINDALQPDWRAKQELDVQSVLAAEASNVWVADVDSIVAGFVAVRVHDDRRIGEIDMLAVDPPHQARGSAQHSRRSRSTGARHPASASRWLRPAPIRDTLRLDTPTRRLG